MQNPLSLRIASTINAPRNKVFAAWTKPEILALWFAPGPRTPFPEILEPHAGGKFKIVMRGEDDSPIAMGEYVEVVADTKLVFTWGWEGDPSQPTLVTVTFADSAAGTEVVLVHERFPNAETCEHHRLGWQAIMDKLPALFPT